MALDTFLRWNGLVLQLIGIGLAAKGIRDARLQYTTRPGVWGALRAPVRRLGRKVFRTKGRQVVGVGGIASASSVGTAHLTTTMPPANPKATLKIRVSALEQQIRRLEAQHNALDRRVVEDARERRKEAADLRDGLETTKVGLNQAIRDLAGGSLRLEAWGVTMIVAGTITAALPGELARAFRAVFWF